MANDSTVYISHIFWSMLYREFVMYVTNMLLDIRPTDYFFKVRAPLNCNLAGQVRVAYLNFGHKPR